MNLRQLEFAAAVAAKKSFSAAAEACRVTQPTLSNGIAKLEEVLGARLFVRTTRSVTLTPLGTHLLPYIKYVLSARETLQTQAQAFINPARQMVRIGVSPLIDGSLLGLMLDPFKRVHPEIDFVLREMNMGDLYRMLDEGLLDYVCGVVDARRERWNSAFLYDEPLVYIPSGAIAQGVLPKTVDLRDIAEATYVMVPDTCGLSRATRALFRRHRKTLHEYSGQALSCQMLEDWATLNVGAAILPESKVAKNLTAARTIRAGKEDVVRIAYEAVWPKERLQAAHLQAFERHLLEVVPQVLRVLAPTAMNSRVTAAPE